MGRHIKGGEPHMSQIWNLNSLRYSLWTSDEQYEPTFTSCDLCINMKANAMLHYVPYLSLLSFYKRHLKRSQDWMVVEYENTCYTKCNFSLIKLIYTTKVHNISSIGYCIHTRQHISKFNKMWKELIKLHWFCIIDDVFYILKTLETI